MPAALSPGRLTLLTGAMAAAAAAASAWYVAHDPTPPTFDAAWYLETASRLYHRLAAGEWTAAAATYGGAFRFKAPLIAVLPLPAFAVAGGPSLHAALSLQCLSVLALAAYVFLLGRRLFGAPAGTCAAAIVLTMPILFGLSRIFVVEYPLTALTAAAAYHLCSWDERRDRRAHVRLGALLGFGLLLKVLFPFYLAGPFIDTLRRRHRSLRGRFRQAMEIPLKTLFVVAALIAATWYGPNLLYVAGYLYKASFGDIAALYTTGLGNYWSILTTDAFSTYYVLAAAAAALWLWGRERFRLAALRRLLGHDGARFCLLWFGIPFLVASAGTNKDIRFMAPALPAFALLLGAGLDRAARADLARRLLPLFFLGPLLQFSLVTFGRPRWAATLFKEHSSYARRPEAVGAWGQEKFVLRLAATVGPDAVVVAGQEHPYFNANTLSYFAAKHDLALSFISYGYAYTRVADTVARLRDKDASHLLLVDGLNDEERDPHAVDLDPRIRRLLAAGRLPFRKIDAMTLKRPSLPPLRIELHERTGTITMFGDVDGR